MKFDRKELLGGLMQVMPAAGKDQQKPVLGCVKIESHGGVVFLECTNLEQHLHAEIEQKQKAEFSLLVSVQCLAEILKRSNAEEVELKPEGQILSVTAGSGQFDLPIHEAKDFPEMPDVFSKSASAAVDASDLIMAINATTYACAKDVARFSMMGVCVSGANNVLDFVATDGRRLAKVSLQVNQMEGVIEPTVVPAVAWRMLAGATGEVQLFFGKRGMGALLDNGGTMHTLLIDGKFPDYKAVIPNDRGKAWRGFAAAELATAVRQAQVMVDRENMRLNVHLGATGPSGAPIVLGGKSATSGSSQITTVTRGEGKGEVSLNPQFLLEALGSMPAGEEVRFEVRGNGPVTLSAGQVYTLIMPQT